MKIMKEHFLMDSAKQCANKCLCKVKKKRRLLYTLHQEQWKQQKDTHLISFFYIGGAVRIKPSKDFNVKTGVGKRNCPVNSNKDETIKRIRWCSQHKAWLLALAHLFQHRFHSAMSLLDPGLGLSCGMSSSTLHSESIQKHKLLRNKTLWHVIFNPSFWKHP